MEACGYEFDNGSTCTQAPNHEQYGVPHLPQGTDDAYWNTLDKLNRQRKADKW